ncbi:MAG: hypothetical protein R3C28_08555 [Pirellulaceae bacterium]
MKCEEFELRVWDILDERQDPAADESITTHANACANCRQLLQQYQNMMHAVTAMHFQVDSTNHSPTVSARKTLPTPSAIMHRTATWVAGIAAVLFMSISLRPTFLSPPLPVSPAPLSANQTSIVETEMAAHRPTSLVELGAPPNLDLEQFAKRIYTTSREVTVSPPEWIQPVTGTIRPLADSVYSTISVLKKTLPSNPTSSPQTAPQASSRTCVDVIT